MKRLVIIVEGDTEVEFVNKSLRKYFSRFEIYDVVAFKIKHSKGGITKYSHLKTDIINVLYEKNTVVTSLIDYYALPKDFPDYEAALKIPNIYDRSSFLENAIKEDIERTQKHSANHLVPYIQLHELEALCFSSFKGIEDNFTPDEVDFEAVKKLIDSVSTPEEINNGPTTAPSKRLKNMVAGYDKIVYGNIIIESIDLPTIIEKCPKFKGWIEVIISKLKE